MKSLLTALKKYLLNKLRERIWMLRFQDGCLILLLSSHSLTFSLKIKFLSIVLDLLNILHLLFINKDYNF